MNKGRRFKFFKKNYLYKAIALFIGLALSILFFFAIFYSKDLNLGFAKFIGAIKPFVYGGAIAYVLVPLANFLERLFNKLFINVFKMKNVKKANKLSNYFSVFSSLIIAILLVYLLLALIIPQLVVSISMIVSNFDTYYKTALDWINDKFSGNAVIHDYLQGITENISTTAQKWLKTEILPNAKTLISNVSTGVLSAFSFIKDFFIGIIVSIYFLLSRKTFAAQSKIFVHCLFKKKIADKVIGEFQFANKMFMGFISGRLVDSAIIGVLCFIGLSILRIPYPLLISVIVGVTNVIPFFGPFIGGIPAAFLILMIDPLKCLWFIIFIIVLQQIDGNIIGPKILGEMTNLNSFWVLFAILLFSGLYGFVGMLVGVPVFAVIYHLAQELIMKGMKRTGYKPSEEEAEVSLLNDYLAAEEAEKAKAKAREEGLEYDDPNDKKVKKWMFWKKKNNKKNNKKKDDDIFPDDFVMPDDSDDSDDD